VQLQFCSVVLESRRQYSRSGVVAFSAVRVHQGACAYSVVDAVRLAAACHAQVVGAVFEPMCGFAGVEGARSV
jgi:hypothetical protein